MDSSESGRRRELDAYLRVSQVHGREGDSFISPQVQEERIRAWAVANGHEIVAVHPELDVSGGTMNRPKLNEVMRRIDQGETDGVVVYNLSRFARTLIGSVELIQRINERGALFASVSDGFDITTVTGRLVMNILLAIAQSERERSQENWRIARAKALGRGIHVSSHLFGYLRQQGPTNPRTGLAAASPLVIDPETGPIVTEIFQRRAAGESWTAIRDWLAASNVPTVRGAPWSTPAVMAIVRRKAYLGIATGGAGGDFPDGVPGAHPALIDEATWQAAQMRVMARRSTEPKSVARGLIRCAGCRYTALFRPYSDGSIRMVCNHRVNAGIGACPAPMSTVLTTPAGIAFEEMIIEQMWSQLERIEFEALDESLDVAADDEELAMLEAKRERDALDPELEASLGSKGWKRHLAELTARITEIEERRAGKLRQAGRPNRPVKELRSDWESGEMPMADKRALLGSVVQAVFVKKGALGKGPVVDPELRRQRILELMHIVWWRDGLEVEVPRQGSPSYKQRPFRFPSDPDPDDAGEASLQLPVVDAGGALG